MCCLDVLLTALVHVTVEMGLLQLIELSRPQLELLTCAGELGVVVVVVQAGL